MAGSSRPAVLIYRQQCKKPFTKRLTGNWGQPYNPPPRQQSAPGRAAALLFDIVDLEGISGPRVWLWLGLFWCLGTGRTCVGWGEGVLVGGDVGGCGLI